MAEEKKLKLGTLPEDKATQISDGQFEPEKGEFLAYFKLVSMSQTCLKNNNHRVENIIGPARGGFVFGDPEDMRIYLHKLIDLFIDAGKEGAKDNT